MVALVGCTAADPASEPTPDAMPWAWAESRDTTGFRPITEAASFCRDCLTLERLTLLGEEDGPGFLVGVGALDVVVDSQGNYWVSQVETVKVFDAAGTFLREVGRQGQGPMEFQNIGRLHVDGRGRVHIIDRVNRRWCMAPN